MIRRVSTGQRVGRWGGRHLEHEMPVLLLWYRRTPRQYRAFLSARVADRRLYLARCDESQLVAPVPRLGHPLVATYALRQYCSA
eukprot:3678031-Rhodomonas_salina.4